MKGILTLTAGLILVSTTFAQSSRRSDSKESNETQRETTVSSERRAPSDNSSRTAVSSNNRREAESQPAERRTEVSAPVSQDRSSVNNRRSPVEDNRNGASAKNNSNTRHYDNDRRGPEDNHNHVIVQEHSRRTVEPRHHTVVHTSYRPVPVEVRRVKYPYRAPVRTEVIWTVDLSKRFEVYYPAYRPVRYHVGSRIATVSAYDAFDFVGEIARVYGRVAETYYSWETDELFLYIGDYYPYQDFSVIIPGREARDFSRRPEKFFEREYIEVTGLITRFEGKPEMVIKRSSQVSVY